MKKKGLDAKGSYCDLYLILPDYIYVFSRPQPLKIQDKIWCIFTTTHLTSVFFKNTLLKNVRWYKKNHNWNYNRISSDLVLSKRFFGLDLIILAFLNVFVKKECFCLKVFFLGSVWILRKFRKIVLKWLNSFRSSQSVIFLVCN